MPKVQQPDTAGQEGGAPLGVPPAGPRYTPAAARTITETARRSRDHRAADQGERVQPMRGFEDTYVDIVDYIIRITDRIWEDQDVGYIYDTYAQGCRVNDDGGPKNG